MKGYFQDESLLIYTEMVAEKIGVDFSENETYDFTRCVKPDGKVYGTRGKCRKGTEGEAKSRESSITATPGMAAKVKAAKEKLKAEIAANGGKRTDRIQEERRLEQNRKQREMDRKEKAAAAARAKAAPKPLRGQHLANMMKDHLNITNRVAANHGGAIRSKAAKEQLATELKKAGVPDRETIRQALKEDRSN
jgi:2',3'-cyclic-nucleotide 2'-phosphodiesterase (5'-nucleotidase family)